MTGPIALRIKDVGNIETTALANVIVMRWFLASIATRNPRAWLLLSMPFVSPGDCFHSYRIIFPCVRHSMHENLLAKRLLAVRFHVVTIVILDKLFSVRL